MSDTNNADGTVETPNIEDLQEQLKVKDDAIAKAEAKIVDMKKSSKETTPEVKTEAPVEVNTEDTSKFMTREDFEKDKFFESNPDLADHKDSINELVSKWYSLDDAKTVTLAKDKTIESRKNTQNSNFTDWASWGGVQTYSSEDLYNLWQKDPALKRKAMEQIAAGKAIETV